MVRIRLGGEGAEAGGIFGVVARVVVKRVIGEEEVVGVEAALEEVDIEVV